MGPAPIPLPLNGSVASALKYRKDGSDALRTATGELSCAKPLESESRCGMSGETKIAGADAVAPTGVALPKAIPYGPSRFTSLPRSRTPARQSGPALDVAPVRQLRAPVSGLSDTAFSRLVSRDPE